MTDAAVTPIRELIERLVRDVKAGAIIGYDGPQEYWSRRMGAEASAEIARLLEAALSRPIDPKAEVEALVKPSIDTMREAAWEVLRKNGWEATARLSLHQVSGLMAQFGMNVSAGEVGCGYPDCGCCDDAACEDAIKQHPDFAPALTPAEKAGVGDGVRCYIAEMGLSDGRTDYYVTIECGGRQITPHMYRIKGRAEYDVAEWNWLFNGGEKPFVLDFDTEDRSLSTTKPAQGNGELTDKIEGLEADLDGAISVAYCRGATEWVKLNYPAHFERLNKTWPAETLALGVIARLRKALEPFAREADELAPGITDDCVYALPRFPDLGLTDFDVGDLRAARAALAAQGDDAQEERNDG